jgi:hypothetical protein
MCRRLAARTALHYRQLLNSDLREDASPERCRLNQRLRPEAFAADESSPLRQLSILETHQSDWLERFEACGWPLLPLPTAEVRCEGVEVKGKELFDRQIVSSIKRRAYPHMTVKYNDPLA